MEIAALGIKVESTGVADATSDLEKLAASGKKAEQSADSVGNAWDKARAKMGVTTKTTKETSDALKAQQEELGKLLGKIDPVTAALGRLDAQEQKLRQFKSKGLLDTETFNDYSAKITQARGALGGFEQSLGKAGVSAKQNAAALRQLPAQFSDIFVSLQGGQAPLTVFLQQGSQIKDSFGGAGNALAQVGRAALGLVNPFTVGAAAVAALAYGFIEGSQESVRFNEALILTGGAAGKTAEQLGALAAEFDRMEGVTQSSAAAALLKVAETGRFTGDQLELVARAAEQMRVATGKAVDETIDEFVRLGKDPVETLLTLNEKQNFLTEAQLENVRALKEQGKESEAVAAAFKIYADTIAQRAPQITENLGLIEKAWRAVQIGAKETLDDLLDIGRALPPQEKINELLIERNKLQNDGLRVLRSEDQKKAIDDRIKAINSEIQAIQNKRVEEIKAAAATPAPVTVDSGEERKRQEAREEFDRLALSNLDKKAKLEREIVDIQKLGIKAGKDQAEIDKQIAAARARYEESLPKARAQRAAPAFQDDAATKQLQTLREQEASLTAQLETGVKISGSQKELVEFNQKIADLKSKDILTAEQKSLLNGEEAIRAQLQLNASIEDEIKKRAQANDNERLRIQILKETGQIRAANDAQIDLDYAQKRLEFERDGNTEALARLETLKKINEIQRETGQKPGTVEGVSKAPTVGGLDAAVGGANSELMRLEREAQAIEDWRENELEKQAAFLEAKAINEETYAERVANIDEQSREKRDQIEQVKNATLIASADEFFGNMATLSQSGNKKLAAIGKAAAIAQATISGFTAIQNALAVPPYPVGLALAVSAGVVTAANIASIAGVGFRDGGYTGSGSDNQIAGPVHKNEFVFDSAATARIGAGNLEALRSGSAQSSAMSSNVVAMPQRSGGNVAVTQNIMVNGNVDRRTAGQIARETSQKQRMAQSRFG